MPSAILSFIVICGSADTEAGEIWNEKVGRSGVCNASQKLHEGGGKKRRELTKIWVEGRGFKSILHNTRGENEMGGGEGMKRFKRLGGGGQPKSQCVSRTCVSSTITAEKVYGKKLSDSDNRIV